MKVLVTGAAGQLGSIVVQEFSAHHDVVALRRGELDITDHRAVLATVDRVRPSVVINCAAYNQVDQAEDEATKALEINALAVRSLARASDRVGATLVHYSTDFVFDGTAGQPYTEEQQPQPESVYATSKLIGEWFAQDAERHYVLRVESLFGGPQRRSSVDRIIEGLQQGREVTVFTDRTTSPSYVVDVARATRSLLALGASPGLYHAVNSGDTTWHELAREVARLLGVEARLNPVPVDEIRLRARRPKYAALSNERLRAAGVPMPSWQDAIARHLASGSCRQ